MAKLLTEVKFIEKKQKSMKRSWSQKKSLLNQKQRQVKILEDLDVERFHYHDVYSPKLSEFHGKHYFTTQEDDQALIGKGSHHHRIQQKLQTPRHIASEKLASRTWEKEEEPFYSQDKAIVKMDRCHNSKLLESEDMSQMLCKLLKLCATPEVDMEPFDGNALNYHYFMALFKDVVESKIDDPSGRLTRHVKYNTGDAKEPIKYCIQLPSNQRFKNAKYLLEKVYGNPHKIRFIQKGNQAVAPN